MATHNQVVHAWANKTGKQQNGPSVYYRGDIIYSYGSHFPMGKHVTLPNGKEVVLITTRGHSVTTSKHLGYVWHATTHLKQVYCDNVEARTKEQHKANYQLMSSERIDCLDKATRARTYKEMWLNDANKKRLALNEYSKLFKLGYREVKALAENELQSEINKFTDKVKAKNKAAERKQKEETARKLVNAILQIKKWQKGENVQCPFISTHIGDFVRVKRVKIKPILIESVSDYEGDILETSKGARVPLNQALKLFKIMKSCAKHARQWWPNHESMIVRVGDFKVDYVESDGTLKVACHTIPLKNAMEAAKIAGIEI